jgi:hypothetical protein
MTLMTRQPAVGEVLRAITSSTTLKVSQKGTPTAFARDFIWNLVSVFSRTLHYLFVGETLTNGLFLI